MVDPAKFEISGQETVFRVSGPFYRKGSQIHRLNATTQDCKISPISKIHIYDVYEIIYVAEYGYVSKQSNVLTDRKFVTDVNLP